MTMSTITLTPLISLIAGVLILIMLYLVFTGNRGFAVDSATNAQSA